MADQAWSEVHALIEKPGPAVGTSTNVIIPVAMQETAFSHFHTHNDPADWRVRDFGIQAVLFFHNGNRLYVTETYADLQGLVKLKVK